VTEYRSPLWHPFTQHGAFGTCIEISRGEGAYLHAADGRTILDAISSWWVITHGHGYAPIADAVARQAAILDQVIFAGFTHEPAETLARKLLAVTPPGLEYVFLSDSGSTAVEVALKMAVGYWFHAGQERNRVVALDHAYHGDTFGAMAVGARSVFSVAYEPMLFVVDRLPFPAAGSEQDTLDAFERLLKALGHEVAALIVEPLVLGAGGMLVYGPQVLAELHRLCRKYDVFFIADEVMTGFGRTGTRFACEQAGITPDLMCLSKGITGGFLPLGATLATAQIYDAYYSTDRARTFWHSSSYTGNPLACAAAVANLQVWEEEPVLERIAAIADYHAARVPAFKGHPALADARQAGTITAFEVRSSLGGYLDDLALKLYRFYLAEGVLLRPLGNVVYVLPPYCVTTRDLDRIYDVIEQSLDALPL
jgi:adenosylmethionine-8-amino-7-oxononanoate aminotransferase